MVMVVLPMRMGMRVVAVVVMMVVAMIMIVMMPEIVVMIMAVVMVVVRSLVRMAVAMAGIGAAHRVEGRHDLLDLGAEPMQHRPDDMIAQDQDAVRRDGRSQMAVADMPGELGQVTRVTAADGVERLVGGRDLDNAAAFDRERIARGQNDRFREIDQDLAAMAGLDHAPAQMALVMLEHGASEHRPGRGGGFRCPPDGYRFQHAALRFGRGRFVHPAVIPTDGPCQALTMK